MSAPAAQAVDLHVHSDKSDGSFPPARLAELAAQKHLSAFALTDHDTTAGIKEAMAAGKKWGVEVIAGIEFSTAYTPSGSFSQGRCAERDIHIVGLFIDEDAPAFQTQLQQFVDARILRNQKMCARLQEAGLPISYEKLLDAFPGSVITRGHYARFLLENGCVKSLPEAFDRYLGDHTPYFVPREKITPAQAVELILSVKGIPVLAHPTLYRLGQEALENLVRTLRQAGLVALETFYPTYDGRQARRMRQLADQYGLLSSGGSDFHGKSKPGLEMGTGYGKLFVGREVLDALKKKRKELFHV